MDGGKEIATWQGTNPCYNKLTVKKSIRMKNAKISKNKLGMIVGAIASLIFLIGVPLRQIQGSLNFLSGLHGTTSAPTGLDLKGTIIGLLFVFVVYFFVGWVAGFIYERV